MTRFVPLLTSLALLLAGCARGARVTADTQPPASAAAEATSPATHHAPRQLDDGWRTASPASVGLNAERLDSMVAAIRRQEPANVHAVLIERDGKLVFEEYFAGEDQRWGRSLGRVEFNRDTKHDLRSVSKSVTSALLGIALGPNARSALDRPLLEFFPQHGDLTTPEKRAITLRHVLTMSEGLQWDEDIPYTDPRNDEIGMTRSTDPVRYVLARPLVRKPGAQWNYNGGTTQLIAEIIQSTTGRPLLEFARSALFEPLGITDVEWLGNLKGTPAAASGLRLRPRDLAKFGSLYLHGGRWNGRQIVPAEWIAESTRRAIDIDTAGVVGYGYQWWNHRFRWADRPLESFTAVGNGQQRIYVLPDLDMVVTILAGRYNDPSGGGLGEGLLRRYIVPAVAASN